MRGRSSKDKKKPVWVPVPPTEVSIPPGYEFLKAVQTTTNLRIYVRPQLEAESCSVCGAALDKYGTRFPSFRDVKQGERTCVLIVRRQQYMCRGPIHHFPGQPLPGIDVKHDMTARLVQHLRINPDLSNVKLAKSVGLSDKTVAQVHLDHAAEIEKRQKAFDVYLALGFDEKRINGVDHFVLVDLVTGTFITMLEGNDRDTIRRELEQYAHRYKVGLIVIDMHHDYSELAKELYPNAFVIYDAFHVLDQLDECRETVRVDAGRLAAGEAKTVLRDRKNFWEGVDDSGGWGDVQCNLFNELPSIVEAHTTYKNFLGFWQAARSPREASRHFDYWVEHIPIGVRSYFETFICTIGKHRDEVFMYFATGATAGKTESVNLKIQVELSRAGGYSEEGASTRMKVMGELTRQRQIDALQVEGDTEEDIRRQREGQLSTDGSLTRSAKMRNQIANARANISMPASEVAQSHCDQGAAPITKVPNSLDLGDEEARDAFTHHASTGSSNPVNSDCVDADASFKFECLSCRDWIEAVGKCIHPSNCWVPPQPPRGEENI